MKNNLYMLDSYQENKEQCINENFISLASISNNFVISNELNSPPADLKNGDLYIVADKDAKNEWAGYENNIAYYYDGWRFLAPNEGLMLWNKKAQKFILFEGVKWVFLNINIVEA